MTRLVHGLALQLAGVAGAGIADDGRPLALHPDEEALLGQAGDKRRRDFALGRYCAHAALAQLGGDALAIGRSESGAPLWPQGFCGSITHTKDYAAALVARCDAYISLGVDAERLGGVTPKLWPKLFDAEECASLSALSPDAQSRAATILFSAKEASFKAWSVPGAKITSFRDIHVVLGDDGFMALSAAGALKGRFAVDDDLVLTAAFIPAR